MSDARFEWHFKGHKVTVRTMQDRATILLLLPVSATMKRTIQLLEGHLELILVISDGQNYADD
jgi:hypothetical protein